MSGSTAAQWTMPRPGRITITTPAQPSSTAAQRCGPTRSFSTGQDSAVRKSGAAKLMTVASASARYCKLTNSMESEPTRQPALSNCSPGLRARSQRRGGTRAMVNPIASVMAMKVK